MSSSGDSYFSVNFDLINFDQVIDYDLYVNSSGKSDKQKFVRIFPLGDNLSKEDLEKFKSKYPQLYIPEKQRGAYLRSIAKSHNIADEEAGNLIKDSAIMHLHNVFDKQEELSLEVLSESISGCRDAVEGMIDLLDDYNIDH